MARAGEPRGVAEKVPGMVDGGAPRQEVFGPRLTSEAERAQCESAGERVEVQGSPRDGEGGPLETVTGVMPALTY